ncbi:MAG: Hsp70 family protein [Candidatus Aminicenantes bacterium]|nr:MAG: Hsp70 family protein [Candidatus Aminicenantes bacterium]
MKMLNYPTCPSCHQWEIKQTDRYCSRCGVLLRNFEAAPDKMRFYIDKEKGKCFHRNKICLNNNGWTKITGISIAGDESVFNIADSIETLDQGEKKEIGVELADPGTIEFGSSSLITIQAGDEKYNVKVEFYYLPEFTLVLEGEEVKQDRIYKIYKFDSFSQIHFILRKSGLTVFQIEDVVIEDDRCSIKLQKKREDFIEGVLTIQNDELDLDREEYIELTIKGKHTNHEARFPFYISIEEPPRLILMVNGHQYREGRKEEIELYSGIENQSHIKISNSGHQELTLEGITVEDPFVKNQVDIQFPERIPPETDRIICLKPDVEKVIQNKMKAAVILHIHEIKDKTIDFLVTKREAKDFDGYLAIDFGTTNTTAAYKTEDEVGFVFLENMKDIEQAYLSPSVIRYEKIIERKPEKYVIGETAKSKIILNPKSSVMSVKTRLGEKTPLKILPVDETSGMVEFYPREVTAHFISRLKEKIQVHLKEKVSKAVITYPSKFTQVQVEEFKQAFNSGGIEVVTDIEEPQAAALNYIIMKKEKGTAPYVIGVFDCGGGTTDITMMEVIESIKKTGKKRQQRVLDVKVLATDGYPRFGGNNFTGIIIDMMKEKIKNLDFETKYEDKEGLRLFFSDNDESNEDMIKRMASRGIDWELEVRKNRAEIWRIAEEWKIALSDNKTGKINSEISLQFLDRENNLVKESLGFVITRKEFETKIYGKIQEFADKLQRMSEKTKKTFDLILLSGLSSQIPLIYRIFTKNFNGIPITYTEDLKKCVVLGALNYYELAEIAAQIKLKFDKGEKLRSAIGIRMIADDGRRKFHEIFPQATSIPTPFKKIELPLERRQVIQVYRNMGTHEYFDDAPEEFDHLRKFNILIPGEVSDHSIEKGEFYLQVKEKLKPLVFVKAGKHEKEYS